MIQSIAIMRSDQGITITTIREMGEPEVQHFPDWVQTKEWLNTINFQL